MNRRQLLAVSLHGLTGVARLVLFHFTLRSIYNHR